MKRLLINLPEYYFIAAAFLAGYTPPIQMNPICLLFIGLLVVQLFIKNKVLGMVLGGLFCLVNLYMLLALISEFKEFPEFDSEAKTLLFTGLALWISTMVAGVALLYKNAKLIGIPNSTFST